MQRVTTSKGARTPGMDGVVWDTPERKLSGLRKLRTHGYRPRPLRRIRVPKGDGKLRPLSIPTIRDRAMQALFLQILEPLAEKAAHPHSYAYRTGRSPAAAIRRMREILCQENAPQWVLRADIEGCFERISHTWLLEHALIPSTIQHKWLTAGFIERSEFRPTEAGIPEGGMISPALANHALDGLETKLAEAFPLSDGMHFVRYADDILVTGQSKHFLEIEVKPLIERFLAERGLNLSASKTLVVGVEDGFDFLGANIRVQRGRVNIAPSRSSVRKFLSRLHETVRSHNGLTALQLLRLLNPKIKSWRGSQGHVSDRAAFEDIDRKIAGILWEWARRRHPRQGRCWIWEQYFMRGVFQIDVAGQSLSIVQTAQGTQRARRRRRR